MSITEIHTAILVGIYLTSDQTPGPLQDIKALNKRLTCESDFLTELQIICTFSLTATNKLRNGAASECYRKIISIENSIISIVAIYNKNSLR